MGQHVLVPVDGSPQADKAFDYAVENLPDPEITLLHVINPVSAFTYGDDEYFDIDSFQAEQKRRQERAEALCEEYREQAAAQDLDVETLLTAGKPAKRILQTVEDHDIDLIVMGSHGRSGVGRVVFGSVAEAVTRRSSVPVTIVR
jgi:nucleotide-binding universal stress UspA family protein